jgi:putative FmdB family regulatory protein
MPTYEYVCTQCGDPLEVVASIHEAALTECPACSGRLRKVFGNVGVVFKGSGFYRTDSRSGKGKQAAAVGAAKSDKSESTSSDSGSSSSEGSAKTPAPTTSKGSSPSSSTSGSAGGSTVAASA